MNTVARSFEALVSVARHCPESKRLELHTANLVAQLAALPKQTVCIALVCKRNFNRYQGFERVLPLLDPYGVQLLRRWHASGKAFFLFAQLLDDTPDPFAGANVIVLEPSDSNAVVLKEAA